MFKKVLTLMLVLVGVLALSACKDGTDPDDPELTALEMITEAMAQVEVPSSASSDLTLVASGLHDVVITWESSNEAVIATDGTVTIPSYTDGDQSVTLTAYLALDGETLTKTFTVSVLAATEMTDQEKADAAATALGGLLTSTNIITDVTLPLEGLHGATVVWASSNADYVTDAGVVTRPAEGLDNEAVTLTATVTVGTATATAELLVTVVADESPTVYTAISDVYSTAIVGDYIEFTGVVVSTFSGGYFLTDGTHALGIYKGSGASAVNPVVGDEVHLKGFYAVYNTLYQLADLTVEEILSSDNANPLVPQVLTVAEIIALDSSDKSIHGMPYTVSGTLQEIADGDYTNIWLVDGEDKIQIYHYSNSDSLDVLEGYLDVEVTFTGTYYTYYKSSKVYFAFDGGVDDVTANLTPQEAFDGDLAVLDGNYPIVSLSDLVLPSVGNNGTVFSGWTSSNTAIYSDLGVFAGVGTVTETVTFTGTATLGDLTDTVTFNVVVPVLSTIAEVLAMEKDDFFQVSGTVYAQYSSGFYLEQDGSYIFVYSYDVSQVVVEGDNITLLGQLGAYNGLTQVYPKSEATVNSQGNTPNVAHEVGTVGDVLNNTWPKGTFVSVTGTVSVVDGDVFITDPAGNEVEVYYRTDVDVLETFDTQIVTVEVIGYDNGRVLFYGEAADVTVETAFTDQYTAEAIAAAIDLGNLTAVNVDLVLPLDNADPVASIGWETSDMAVVTADGVITMVSGSTPSATLTATVTVGTATATRDFVVTLMDLNDNAPMTVAEALLLEDDAVVIVQGVIVGMFYDDAIVQDASGAAIYVADIDGALGDEVVVVGTLGTNVEYGDNQRNLFSATKLSTESTGNDLVVSVTTDVATILGEVPMMYRYTTTLTVTSLSDGYGYALFNTDVDDENGFKIKLSNDVPEYFADFYEVGSMIELTFTVSDIDYSNARVVSVVWPELTDADMVQAAVNSIEIPETVVADLTPPAEVYGAAITWSSDTPAVITNEGVVTRPAEGQADATVVITGTFVLNAVTVVETWTVTVPALTAAPTPELFISEYGEPDGGTCKYIEIYNPTDADVDLSIYAVSKSSNGAALPATGDFVLSGTLNAGEAIVLGSAACLDPGDAAQTEGNPAFPLTGITFVEWSSATWNGDDPIGLYKNDVLIDKIGIGDGVDPGAGWVVGSDDTANVILRRDSSVVAGETDWSVAATQWVVYDHRDYSDVGIHTVD